MLSPRRLCALLFVTLVCLPGCYREGGEEHGEDQTPAIEARVADFLGGPSTVALIQSADEVTAFRMGRHKTPDGELFLGYPVLSSPVNVESEFVERLLRILVDRESYLWDAGKACKFDPGVGMRFRQKDREVNLVFCFTCDQLLVVAGEHKQMEDTDPARRDLLAIMKEIFPHDDLIQKLR